MKQLIVAIESYLEKTLRLIDELYELTFDQDLISASATETQGASDTHQNVTFTDLDPGYGVNIGSLRDSTYDLVKEDDNSLGDFLGRPTRIYENRWSSALPTAIVSAFNPWKLFCENTAIFEKIKYYNNLSGDLHVKFVINGNSFMMGRLLCSYQPVHTLDEIPAPPATFNDYIQYSQRPHVMLNPTTNEGGTMKLPFFWYHNYLSIPDSDWDDMGEIMLLPLTPLKHASNEDCSVTVKVYAWMENVILATPTSLFSASLTEAVDSGDLQSAAMTVSGAADEYGKGILSKPASAVAAAAGMLANIPAITPYARATEMVAKGVGNMASLFGYSRPPDLSSKSTVIMGNNSNLATVDAPDNVFKLTLDSKNELTIDSRTVGLDGVDQMGIYDIAQRISLLTNVDWNTYEQGDIPSTVLFSCAVNPALSAVLTASGPYYMTPMCHMSQLFSKWHGSIIYRFQVVASQFHKGRLLVQYDPQVRSSFAENTMYSEIVDIAETRDFEVEVGWGQAVPYLNIPKVGRSYSGGNKEFKTDGTEVVRDTTTNNGVLTVSVLNELTVPGDPTLSPPITINVWVKAGDLQFAVPDADKISDLSLTQLLISASLAEPRGLISASAVTTDANTDKSKLENNPEETMKMQVNQETSESSKSLVFFGEHIVSLRSYLKRYAVSQIFSLETKLEGGGATWASQIAKAYPLYRASFSEGNKGVLQYTETGTGSKRDLNPAATIPFTYVAPIFVGWRGALRHKIINPLEIGSNNRVAMVRRLPYAGSKQSRSSGTITNQIQGIKTQFFSKSANGTEITQQRNSVGIEFEIPFYQGARFRSTRILNPASIPGERFEYTVYKQLENTTGSNNSFPIDWLGTGEDFTFFFFLNVPRFYRWDIPNPT